MSNEIRSVAELDDLVKRGIVRNDDTTRVARNNLALWEHLAANPHLVHKHPTKDENAQTTQKFIEDCKARGVEPTVIDLNLTGVSEVTLGGGGQIVSITKDGNPPVTVPPADTSVRN